ncbi:hypothetical protein [Mycoplasma sp. VS410B]|uniref:hypothetical protein n=1 Tax=Mycoplasma sp. VS410B TaxID=3401688 RepID=UPI003AB0914C
MNKNLLLYTEFNENNKETNYIDNGLFKPNFEEYVINFINENFNDDFKYHAHNPWVLFYLPFLNIFTLKMNKKLYFELKKLNINTINDLISAPDGFLDRNLSTMMYKKQANLIIKKLKMCLFFLNDDWTYFCVQGVNYIDFNVKDISDDQYLTKFDVTTMKDVLKWINIYSEPQVTMTLPDKKHLKAFMESYLFVTDNYKNYLALKFNIYSMVSNYIFKGCYFVQTLETILEKRITSIQNVYSFDINVFIEELSLNDRLNIINDFAEELSKYTIVPIKINKFMDSLANELLANINLIDVIKSNPKLLVYDDSIFIFNHPDINAYLANNINSEIELDIRAYAENDLIYWKKIRNPENSKTINDYEFFNSNNIEYVIKNYKFTKNEISELIDDNNLLKYLLIKYYNNGESKSDSYKIINDDLIQKELKDKILYLLKTKRKITLVGNCVMHISISNLSKYILKEMGCALSALEIKDLLNIYINDYDLKSVINPEEITERQLLTILSRDKNVFSSLYKKFRYYDFYAYDFSEFINKLSLEQYYGKIISAKLIFDNNKELMENYDIQNEYELHNLIRKLVEGKYIEDSVIQLGRMPTLKFTKDLTIEDEILDALRMIQPAFKEEIIDFVAKEYGFNEGTITGTYFKAIDKYYIASTNKYFINEDYCISDEEANKIKEKLFYPTYDKKVLDKYIRSVIGSEKEITNIIYNKLEYTCGTSCCIKNEWKSVPYYINYIIENNKFLKLNEAIKNPEENSYIIKIYWTYNIKLKLLNEYKIFKYSNINEEFLTYKWLNQNTGLELWHIEEFISKVQKLNKKYFSLKQIYNVIDDIFLINQGYDDIFYESILLSSKKFQSILLGNENIYCVKTTSNNFPVATFIEDIVSQYFQDKKIEKVHMDDLLNYIQSEFLITFNDKTYERISKNLERITKYYYNKESRWIYRDKNNYLTLLEEIWNE